MKRPKKRILLYVLCLAALLTACGNREEEPADTAWRADQMAYAIWGAQPSREPLEGHTLSCGDAEFAPYLRGYYRLDPADVAEGEIVCAGGVNAQEIAVLRLTEAADADKAEKSLQAYIASRAGAFAGYAPEQYEILQNAGTARRGRYVALLIAPDQKAAQAAFAACFTNPPPEDEPAVEPDPLPVTAEPEPKPEPKPLPDPDPEPIPEPEPEPEPEPAPEPEPEPEPQPEPVPDPPPEPEPPQAPWSYDQSRLTAAWTTGDREGLYPEDLEMLVILEEIPALSDQTLPVYEKELALHDWMIDWAEYDPGALSNDPVGDPMPNNDNPYGFLTGRKGICLGYATTFQLLMELSGVECVTVRGLSHGGTADHAWNLVKLEGEWYAVDTTWDDPVASFPIPRTLAHRYFNVTCDFLRGTDHQWDESAFPEASATDYAWAG